MDKTAESLWLSLGGRVLSFRIRQQGDRVHGLHSYVAEVWDLGGVTPRCFAPVGHPSWATRESALFYRNMLIAEAADRVIAFHRRGRSVGTSVTVDAAYAEGDYVHEYQAA